MASQASSLGLCAVIFLEQDHGPKSSCRDRFPGELSFANITQFSHVVVYKPLSILMEMDLSVKIHNLKWLGLRHQGF